MEQKQFDVAFFKDSLNHPLRVEKCVFQRISLYWARIVELYKDGAPDTAQGPVKHISLAWKPARSCWHRLFTS